MSKERTAEEWGRVAVSLPGWRWMPGMLARNFDGPVRVESVTDDQPGVLHRCRWTGDMTHADIRSMPLPDPDDHATAGCLLALLGPLGAIMHGLSLAGRMDVWSRLMHALMHDPKGLGRACIAVAEVNGRWPGGEG
jgi:hypothetical protein